MQTKRRSPVSCRRKWAYLVEHGALGSLYSPLPVAMGRPNHNNRGNDDSQVDCAASAPDPLHAPDPPETEPSVAKNRIVIAEWSRRIPDHGTHSGSAHRSALGQRPVGPTDQRCAAIREIAVVQQLRTYPAVQQFILSYPGQGNFQPPVYEGFPV